MPNDRTITSLPQTNWRAVLFDLDGTLLDTLQDIADSANWALADQGFPTHSIGAYRHFIGEGVNTLFARALPDDHEDPEQIAECILRFRHAYEQRWDVHTRPYEGVEPLLRTLTAAGIPMAVLSNKPDEFTKKCVHRYLRQVPFAVVLGQREGIPRKPDPTVAEQIARTLAVPSGQCLYLGDTAIDMQTACRAGMHPVGAAWGFRSVEELWSNGAAAVLEHPRQLLGLLQPAEL